MPSPGPAQDVPEATVAPLRVLTVLEHAETAPRSSGEFAVAAGPNCAGLGKDLYVLAYDERRKAVTSGVADAS